MSRTFRLLAILIATNFFPSAISTADAADYLFGVPKAEMLVSVNPDASAKIVYDITFRNSPGGHAIDIVDIGTPHSGYDLGNVAASIDGHPLREVRNSSYVQGFEVHLGRYAIQPGGTGTLHVEFTMPDMVYQDTTDGACASMRITPTYFGERFVLGNTHLMVAIQLPESVEPNEVKHQGLNFSQKAATDRGALVGWNFPATRLTDKHMVAVSFPKRDMRRVIEQSAIDLLVIWFKESPRARVALGIIYLVLLAIVFFRFSGGTGFSVFVVLAAVSGFVFYYRPGIHLLAMPAVVVLLGLNEWLLARRKSHYMPPIAEVEGGGIKRGLTAPEAAVLLELPIAKVLSLVIFGMLKKGLLRQVNADPLTVEVDEAFRLDDKTLAENGPKRQKAYAAAAVKRGVVVHHYEHPFLFLLQSNPGKPVRDIQFAVPMKMLIQSAAARMKGFDLSDTRDYYRSIIRRATEQAASIGDIPQREKALNRNFEWILMDDDYGRAFDYGRPYRPIWWGRGGGFSGPIGPSAAPSAGGGADTSFGDVAASFSGWAENTFGGMADAIAPGSLSLPDSGGGFLNLSGVDHVAGEFFSALAKSGGGGGGGGGGCACACAGCACACACAGGGR
ncbi:MAG: hypothetical protein JW959_00325 [Pirellulales bacterium]|nr:hypothetical protein [Pirellulales bacterium]